MPEIERLDEICVLITGDKFACFANLTDVSKRITVIQMAMTSEISDSLYQIRHWFDESKLWEGRVD